MTVALIKAKSHISYNRYNLHGPRKNFSVCGMHKTIPTPIYLINQQGGMKRGAWLALNQALSPQQSHRKRPFSQVLATVYLA